MKKILIALTICCLSCLSFVNFDSNSIEVLQERITFYKVNLVCGAASDIGCGSLSKPILLDLQKEENIKEAWINRAGTITAVVWEDDTKPQTALISTIFKKQDKSIETLEGNAYQEQLTSFRTEKWYKGSEVDELSMEEAGRITKRIIDQLLNDKVLSKEDAPKMHTEVEAYIQNAFLTLEDVGLLYTTTYYDQWEVDIRKIGEKYIETDKMPKIEMCNSVGPSCKKEGKASCCSKDKAKAASCTTGSQ